MDLRLLPMAAMHQSHGRRRDRRDHFCLPLAALFLLVQHLSQPQDTASARLCMAISPALPPMADMGQARRPMAMVPHQLQAMVMRLPPPCARQGAIDVAFSLMTFFDGLSRKHKNEGFRDILAIVKH